MHEEAPHRLAEMTDLDPDTGEPIEPEGAWPVGLWRPPRIDLGIRWGPLPPLGIAALVVALIAAGFRAASWLQSGFPQDPAALVSSSAWFLQELLYGLAPAALLMARPDAARRHPALAFGLLTACVSGMLEAAWYGLWALQILEAPAGPQPIDLNMVVAVGTGAAAAIAAVLIAYGLWSAPGPGARRKPGRAAGLLFGAVLLLYAGPDVWRTFLAVSQGADQGATVPFSAVVPFLAVGLFASVGTACQVGAVATRLGAGAGRSTAWRSAGAWMAISVASTVLAAAFLGLSEAGVVLPSDVSAVVTDAWDVLGAVGIGFMTLAFGQGLPDVEPDAEADSVAGPGSLAHEMGSEPA